MSKHLSPGVYIEKMPLDVKSIEDVSTSTGAFVGIAEKGPIGQAVLISNWTQFKKIFGNFIPDYYLAHAVYQFFKQGGTRCYVLRTCHYDEKIMNVKTKAAKYSTEILKDRSEKKSILVSALSEGKWGDKISVETINPEYLFTWDEIPGNDSEKLKEFLTRKFGIDWVKTAKIEKMDDGNIIKVYVEKKDLTLSLNNEKTEVNLKIDDVRIDEFRVKMESGKLKIYNPGKQEDKKFNLIVKFKKEKNKHIPVDKKEDDIVEIFDGLTISDVEDRINGKSAYIKVEKDDWDEGNSHGSGEMPKDQTIFLKNGYDGIEIEKDGKNESILTQTDFIGDSSTQNGLHAFDPFDINIVAIPDQCGDRNTMLEGFNYCQNRKDCFFIADPPKAITPKQVLDFKNGIWNFAGNEFNTSFGALYYPWVLVNDPLTGNPQYPIPPSCIAVGTISHVDTTRGVHKAPAGTPDGYLDSVVGLETMVTKGEHGLLNNAGINIIRRLPTSGICIWGARTLSSDPEWMYINIRRLFLYLEKSIDNATQWAVFEPNSPSLWSSVIRNITAFLLKVWKEGRLLGSTPEEAFYIKVDEENNTEKDRDEGKLNIEVGVAPVSPTEFIIIKISQKTLAK